MVGRRGCAAVAVWLGVALGGTTIGHAEDGTRGEAGGYVQAPAAAPRAATGGARPLPGLRGLDAWDRDAARPRWFAGLVAGPVGTTEVRVEGSRLGGRTTPAALGLWGRVELPLSRHLSVSAEEPLMFEGTDRLRPHLVDGGEGQQLGWSLSDTMLAVRPRVVLADGRAELFGMLGVGLSVRFVSPDLAVSGDNGDSNFTRALPRAGLLFGLGLGGVLWLNSDFGITVEANLRRRRTTNLWLGEGSTPPASDLVLEISDLHGQLLLGFGGAM